MIKLVGLLLLLTIVIATDPEKQLDQREASRSNEALWTAKSLSENERLYFKTLADRQAPFTLVRRKRSLYKKHSSFNDDYENGEIGDPYCNLPPQFDARKQWPKCESIGRVHDQSQCHSSWAIVPSSILTDRLCIHTKGEKRVELSSMDLISCCERCAISSDTCDSGYATRAWKYLEREGLVTGGSYRNASGCLSYKFEPCDRENKEGCSTKAFKAPRCERKCDSKYGREFKADKYYAKPMYFLSNEREIQCDIMKNGPVMTSIDVFEDFYGYQRGVYKHKWGYLNRGQDVKLIGWGEERGIKYWVGINSWGKKWGHQGEFRILRGSNHMRVEDLAMSAKPDLERLH